MYLLWISSNLKDLKSTSVSIILDAGGRFKVTNASNVFAPDRFNEITQSLPNVLVRPFSEGPHESEEKLIAICSRMFGNDHLITSPEPDRLARRSSGGPLLVLAAATPPPLPPHVTESFNCYRRRDGLVVNGCCTTVSSANCFKMCRMAAGWPMERDLPTWDDLWPEVLPSLIQWFSVWCP